MCCTSGTQDKCSTRQCGGSDQASEILQRPDITLNCWGRDGHVLAIAGRNCPGWEVASHFPQLVCITRQVDMQQSGNASRRIASNKHASRICGTIPPSKRVPAFDCDLAR